MSGAKTRIILNDERVCQIGVLSLSGDTVVSELGKLKYNTDQSSQYTLRSIPDVGYVTGITNNIGNRVTIIENGYITGGTNGICKSGKYLKLGGLLTESTTITGGYTLSLCNGAQLNTQYGYNISGNTVLRNSQRSISSIFLGYHNCSNGTGTNNIGIGSCVLSATTSGYNNIGVGNKVLNGNIGGYDNIGIGSCVLSISTGSVNNIGIGNNSMNLLTSGVNNIGLGCNVMYCCSVSGCDNIGIGIETLKGINSGCNNIGIGSSSLSSITSGLNNIGIGYNSLLSVTTGCNNIGIGQSNGLNTNGCNNIYIGLNAGNSTLGSNRLYISNSSSCNLIFGDFTGNTITLPILKLCTTPSVGTSNDSILVWNSTDKTVKKVNGSSMLTNGITGATNGLTKVGQTVKLGGTLTGDTMLSLSQKSFSFSGSYINHVINDSTPGLNGCEEIKYSSSSGGTNITSHTKNSFNEVEIGVYNENTPFQCESINISFNTGMKITDSLNCRGFIYTSDYSNNFENESLVTKRYVTGLTVNAGIQNACNGLNKLGNTVRLGGDITGDTVIYGCNKNISFGCSDNYLGSYNVYSNAVSLIGLNSYLTCSTGDISIFSDNHLNLKASTINICGLAGYNTDYSSSYTTRSLVDKGFVTGLTTNMIIDGVNGLTKTNNKIKLGGSITGDTSINGAFTLGFSNSYINLTGSSGVNISGAIKLLSTPNSGLSSDSVLVWNSTDKLIKSLNLNTVISNAITGASNGLTKSSQNVKFGGALSESTLICGSNNNLSFGCVGSLINDYYVCSVTNTICSTGNVNIFSDSYINLKSSLINICGLMNYNSDLSSSYTNRSLVDKGYVDSVATGLDVKTAVVVATTENITLSGLQTIDGISLSAGNRVLVKNQTTQWRNGIYDASSGVWSRSSDYDFSITSEINNGDLISVLSGTTNANSIWALTSPNPIISGVTNLVFSKFLQQSGVISGNGICIINSGINKEISVNLDTNSGLLFNGTALSNDWNKYRVGLCVNNYKVDLRVTRTAASGTEIPVAINTGGTNTLYVDSSCISSALGTPIICATNGLTKIGNNVILGGTLTGNTVIAGASKDFILGCNSSLINEYKMCSVTNTQCSSGNVNILSDGAMSLKGTTINVCGLSNYNTDYSSSYINRSLVDKGYVTGLTNTINNCLSNINSLYLTGATNGLAVTGKKLKLGGTLTGNTSIIGAYTLGFSNSFINLTGSSGVNISGPTKLLSSPTTGVGSDLILVWNSTDKSIKTITASTITGATANHLQCAANGLSKIGTIVVLGGTLTGNTTINTSTYELNIDGNGLYDVCTCIVNSCAGNGGSVYTQSCQTNSLLYLAHCNVSQAKSSNISLCNGEIKQVSSLNNCITACNCISGLVINTGTTGYDITPSYSKLYFGTTAYQNVCNNGTSNIYGLNGVNVSTPSVNGISLTGGLKLLTIPNSGATTDTVLMYNSSDCLVKQLNFSCFGDKNNNYCMAIVDSSTGLTNSSSYVILVNHTLPVTVDLPASPTNGIVFKIKDVSTTGAYTNNVTIGRNGKLIDRQANNASINTDSGAMELIYNSTFGSWFSLSFIN